MKKKYVIDDVYMWVQNGHLYTAWFYRVLNKNMVEIWDTTIDSLVLRRARLSDTEINLLKCRLKKYNGCKRSFDANALHLE